mmetsp:Transcript_6026/g.13147  ORF Transcript_6026/g.13147 Transcript_6026/m.13147 type:complete len:167 (+) Transcript_6026:274-774(+)|eukprot:CAMPEP_0202894768 /NCGR_PEP_ID=MMETSP1392-20130828/4095_1 /ASSEMBLY_ACC=CAM_ASM_000868 /TAXON_ID=225041 /ORGANISM="Chlamydomonas chlamydogama, Strain SAG 11-48b" /LENGTH=166 /DNA_ID=CAMNT_0049579555 /DNA_START=174 /DNA_END=674 /DNA_ORIENTATION=+
MGGSFIFAVKSRLHFKPDAYQNALKEIKQQYKVPPELYVSFGPKEYGIGMTIKVHHRHEWALVLPLDPTKSDIECGFTYGIVSRRSIWEYVRTVLCHVCRACPHAFDFQYEDHDLGDVVEVGYFNTSSGSFVVQHRGLPSPEEQEARALFHQRSFQRSSQPETNHF